MTLAYTGAEGYSINVVVIIATFLLMVPLLIIGVTFGEMQAFVARMNGSYVAKVPLAIMYFIGVIVVTRFFVGNSSWSSLAARLGYRDHTPYKKTFICLFLGILLTTLGDVGTGLISTLPPLPSGTVAAYCTSMALIVARDAVTALSEEIAYRWYVLQYVTYRLGEAAGIILSSTLFAMVHFTLEPFDLHRALSLILLGVMLAYVFLKSGSLLVTSSLHLGWNLGEQWFDEWEYRASPQGGELLSQFYRSNSSVLATFALILAAVVLIEFVIFPKAGKIAVVDPNPSRIEIWLRGRWLSGSGND